MNQRESEADCETGESDWSAFMGRAEDDDQEHERHHDLAHEAAPSEYPPGECMA